MMNEENLLEICLLVPADWDWKDPQLGGRCVRHREGIQL